MRLKVGFLGLLLALVAGCGDSPTGCEGTSCPSGYAVIRGTVTQANNSPFANGAVKVDCNGGALVENTTTDSGGRYQFDLAPLQLPQSHLWPCVVIAGTTVTVRDTTNVFFAVTRDRRQTYVVDLRFPN